MKFLINIVFQVLTLMVLIVGWDVDVEQVGPFKFICVWVVANISLVIPNLFKDI